MILLQWSRVSAIGLTLLAFGAILPGSTSYRKDIKELKLRNKKEGIWSAWSPWSVCSRPCGGGIRSQTRQCQIRRSRLKSKEAIEEAKLWKNVSANHCEGHGARHHLCNAQECPRGTIGIRESQCKNFNNRLFMGKVYQWEAFVAEKNPCSLTCRAKGFRFFTTLSRSVIDGTPCALKSNHFQDGAGNVPRCVMGQCLSIGCDGIAGSQRRFDRCGVCGGDNSTCRVISGIFTRPQLPVGYNMVAHIPRGACNLNITQIRKSPNYLALRKNDGSYILNGNWAVSWPGEYQGAGSKFHYVRQNGKSLESIEARGPLTEPIDLLVLSQQPNPGIKYEYMLPMNDVPIPPIPAANANNNPGPPATYRHHRQQSAATLRPSAFIPSNQYPTEPRASLYLSKQQSNSISSFPKEGNLAQYAGESAYSTKPQLQFLAEHPHLHGHHGRRPHHTPRVEKSNLEKRFVWKVTGYTNCSEPCGGGTQKSIIRCIKEQTGTPVNDRRCTALEKPPAQTAIRCNLRPCPAEWIVGPWSSCSELCGEGSQIRSVTCQQRVSPTLTMRVAEGACLDVQPESRKSCFLKACHRWESTPWTPCSATCGNGIRRRKVRCINSDGDSVSQCPTEDKPIEISPCNMGPCDGVDWFMSDWSNDCSQTCGTGIQSRHVLCTGVSRDRSRRHNRRYSSRETETNFINESYSRNGKHVETNLCDRSRKPSEDRECSADRECRQAEWFTGPWAECSASCGNGYKKREVLCLLLSRRKFRIVDESHCPDRSRPSESQRCINERPCPPRWFMTEWSECSVNCGGGTQRRRVSCRASNWTQPSYTCSDADRPIDRRSCNDHDCKNADISPRISPPANTWSRGYDSRESSSYVPVIVKTTRKPPPPTTNLITTSHSFMEPNEEPDSSECTDQYKNCALVVQARLCRYKYYRSVCCTSCANN